MSAPGKTRPLDGGALSADGRSRSKLSREIALTLLVKLALIIATKFVFFSDPVSKTEVVERLDTVFRSQSTQSEPTTSFDQRKEHD